MVGGRECSEGIMIMRSVLVFGLISQEEITNKKIPQLQKRLQKEITNCDLIKSHMTDI